MIFNDRTEAGRFLADRLSDFAAQNPVILALPRGGVPVAFEIAQALDAPLDVLISRKLGAPSQPEFGFGAISGDSIVLDAHSVQMLGLDDADVDEVIQRERREALRREQTFRQGAAPINVKGRTVIVVDDGLATGVTARAACRALRARRPEKIIFAAPVCASDSAATLREYVDEVYCGYVPPQFMAVGQWYREFPQTSDDEVIELLARGRSAHAAAPADRLEERPPP